MSLIGGVILSFYDWYADLPPASPHVFGDQTGVPESGDWWNADYLIIWGTNLPTTRIPDAHFMVEARYRGQKVVVVSPDYAEHVKFADRWLAAEPGSDGALAMAMGHVILREFYVEREVPYFSDYARRFIGVAGELARDRGALDDLHGLGHEPLVHSDQTYRTFLALVMLCGCEGRNGHGSAAAGDAARSRSIGSGRLGISRARLSSICTPASGATSGSSPSASPPRSGEGCSTGATSPTSTRSAPGWGGCRPTRALTEARSSWSKRPSAPGSSRRPTSSTGCARGSCGSRARTRTRRRTSRGC